MKKNFLYTMGKCAVAVMLLWPVLTFASRAEVTLTSGSVVAGAPSGVTLYWTESAGGTLSHTLITWSPGNTSGTTISAGITTYAITDLDADTIYSIRIRTVDNAGNKSTGTSIKTKPDTSRTFNFIYIHTAAELNNIRDLASLSSYCLLMADLDLSEYGSGTGWLPISIFTGIFEGNNHVIKNLYINDSSGDYKGLFGTTRTAQIYDLGVVSVKVTGNDYIGGLAGSNEEHSIIENCYVTGEVNGRSCVGGLVGYNDLSVISNCRAICTVSASDSAAGGLVGYYTSFSTVLTSEITNCHTNCTVRGIDWVGGLVGFSILELCNITNCYSTSTVTGYGSVGGFIGRFENGSLVSFSNIKNCYATGNVSGENGIGGFIGYYDQRGGDILNCYATGTVGGGAYFAGGFIGSKINAGTVTNCYYLSDPVDSSDATKKTSAEMKQQTTYTGWDFGGVWAIDGGINKGYPYLQAIAPDPDNSGPSAGASGGSGGGSGSGCFVGSANASTSIGWLFLGMAVLSAIGSKKKKDRKQL